jgi:hypothetical protein
MSLPPHFKCFLRELVCFHLFFFQLCSSHVIAFVDIRDLDFSTLFKVKSGLTRVIDVNGSCAARRTHRRRHKQRVSAP